MSDVFSTEERELFERVSALENSYHYTISKISESNAKISEFNIRIAEWTAHKNSQQTDLDKTIKSLEAVREQIATAIQPKVVEVKLVKTKAIVEDDLGALENRSNSEKSHGKSKSQRSSG